VRVLGIETSSSRGSVALVDGSIHLCSLEHERANAHGESILPLIEAALAQAGWNRSQLDRIAVGTGPGSFTGLRVGIAIAMGLSEGLEVPLVGVPSLRAMALAVPAESVGCRCVLVDARKGELFAAAYDPDGRERLEVRLIAGVGELTPLLPELGSSLFLGNGALALPPPLRVYRSAATDLPHARWTASAALDATPGPGVRPLYVRDAGAVMPHLPPNPLQPARSE
jgi:tRNA threonylcarbamoyladenosine biosynthesis protein TsaB